ncbi:hypothetical protein LJR039_003576 [Pseudorhodoferax sp. LjRoot39]
MVTRPPRAGAPCAVEAHTLHFITVAMRRKARRLASGVSAAVQSEGTQTL